MKVLVVDRGVMIEDLIMRIEIINLKFFLRSYILKKKIKNY